MIWRISRRDAGAVAARLSATLVLVQPMATFSSARSSSRRRRGLSRRRREDRAGPLRRDIVSWSQAMAAAANTSPPRAARSAGGAGDPRPCAPLPRGPAGPGGRRRPGPLLPAAGRDSWGGDEAGRRGARPSARAPLAGGSRHAAPDAPISEAPDAPESLRPDFDATDGGYLPRGQAAARAAVARC